MLPLESDIVKAAPAERTGTPVTRTEEQPEVTVEIQPDEKMGRPQLADEEVEKLDAALSEDEVAKYAKDAQRRIKNLHLASQEWRRRVIQANKDTATATNLAQELYEENKRLKATTHRSETALVEQAIQRADAMLTQAQTRLRTALATSNVDEITAAQTDLARYAAESDRLKLLKPSSASGTDDDGAAPAAGATPSAPAAAQPRPVSDLTRSWISKNPWFGKPGGEVMTGFAMGVHNELAAQGVTEISDPQGYFSTIDKRLREMFPSKFKDKEKDGASGAAAEPERAARPVAVVGGTRVSGVAANGNGKTPRHVTLTESQVRVAKNLGITVEQYAAQLIKEGKVN